VAVVGIAGPGDPMANPEATLETLRLVRARFPEMLMCLASNGLALAEHVDELRRLRLSHLTITINTLEPATGARIYAWVRDGKRVLRGPEAARLLLDRQRDALAALRHSGILVKVNAILMPGVNDGEIAAIAAEARRLGAHLFNCLPLIPAPGTPFSNLPAPDAPMLVRVRAAAAAHLPLMEHCSRCRADAGGLLNEGTGEVSLVALRRAASLKREPERPHIAVATREGLLINHHLGEASDFAIYRSDGDGFQMLERREAPPPGTGPDRWHLLAARLSDCRALLVSGAGPSPRRALEASGIQVIETDGLIEDALGPLFRRQPLSPHRVRHFAGCGVGCAGTGAGCG
jgi:nitrogen fixation protein NifB